jgi:hypothetical protein
MGKRLEGKYRIGCIAFEFNPIEWVSRRPGCTYGVDLLDAEDVPPTETTYIPSGYREHWILLADLCLRAAESSSRLTSKVAQHNLTTRDKVRAVRQKLAELTSQAKEAVTDFHNNGPDDYEKYVGWVK